MDELDLFMAAIRMTESGSFDGNYTAEGPPTGRMGRARGAYQIMDANIPNWLKEAGLAGADFRDPAVQDAVARYKFLQYYRRYNDWGLVAIAWFAGPGRADQAKRQGLDSLVGIRDVLGTSVPDYVKKMRGYMDQYAEMVGYNEDERRGRGGFQGAPPVLPTPFTIDVSDPNEQLLNYLLSLQTANTGEEEEVDQLQLTKGRLTGMLDRMSNAIAGGRRMPRGATLSPTNSDSALGQLGAQRDASAEALDG